MGTRENAVDKDFSGIPLEEEVEEELKETAIISMGTEISEVDLVNIMSLCDQARTVPLFLSRPSCFPWNRQHKCLIAYLLLAICSPNLSSNTTLQSHCRQFCDLVRCLHS